MGSQRSIDSAEWIMWSVTWSTFFWTAEPWLESQTIFTQKPHQKRTGLLEASCVALPICDSKNVDEYWVRQS